ncbi:MAG: DNA replication/repair protein RecF [Patescibacteria group bacterium]
MQLKNLQLFNFRSHKQKNFTFTKEVTTFVGPNATGKTNILEAVTLLALGKSFRADKDEEMITFEEEFGRISGEVEDESLEVVLTHGTWQGKPVAKKRFVVNGVGKRRKDFMGRLKVVLFEPQDIQLVVGSPGHKRAYLDFVLSQIDWEYDRSLLSYQKGLRQRNKLLSAIAEGKAHENQLEFWNRLLIKNGEILRKKRDEYVTFLNTYCSSAQFREIMDRNLEDIPYFTFIYDPSTISPERLLKYHQAEIASSRTLIGPHRDTFSIFQQNHKKRDLATYGSRGEQRMGVLALKMGELEFITQKTGKRPLLLLDDIFSELDKNHQKMVLNIITKQQTLIATTEVRFIEKPVQTTMELVTLD